MFMTTSSKTTLLVPIFKGLIVENSQSYCISLVFSIEDCRSCFPALFILIEQINHLSDVIKVLLLKPDCRGAIALANFCHCFNLSQLVSRPTRVTKTTEPLIGVIITSNPQQVIETDVMPNSISDHDLPYINSF